MQEIESIETTENTAENTAMQMVETTEMEQEMARVMKTILPMPTEPIEESIEASASPVNKEVDNEEQSFVNECHGIKWRHPIEVLDAKIN